MSFHHQYMSLDDLVFAPGDPGNQNQHQHSCVAPPTWYLHRFDISLVFLPSFLPEHRFAGMSLVSSLEFLSLSTLTHSRSPPSKIEIMNTIADRSRSDLNGNAPNLLSINTQLAELRRSVLCIFEPFGGRGNHTPMINTAHGTQHMAHLRRQSHPEPSNGQGRTR